MVKGLICIEGNIASGKTSLLNILSENIRINRIYEKIPNTTWLEEYYNGNKENHLLLELAFLEDRYFQLKNEVRKDEINISDFSFYRSLIIGRKTLNETEFKIFEKLFLIIEPFVPKPDIIICINAPLDVLLSNRDRRGNFYENNIDFNYLNSIDQSYKEFISRISTSRKITLNINKGDFVNDKKLQNNLKKQLLNAINSDNFETTIDIDGFQTFSENL